MLSYCIIDPFLCDIAFAKSANAVQVCDLLKRIGNRHIVIDPVYVEDEISFGEIYCRQFQDQEIAWLKIDAKSDVAKAAFCKIVEALAENNPTCPLKIKFLIACLCFDITEVVYLAKSTHDYLVSALEGIAIDAAKLISNKLVFQSVVIDADDLGGTIQGSLASLEHCSSLFSGDYRIDQFKGFSISVNIGACDADEIVERLFVRLANCYDHVFWIEPHLFSPPPWIHNLPRDQLHDLEGRQYRFLHLLKESGVKKINIVSGYDPGSERRNDQYNWMTSRLGNAINHVDLECIFLPHGKNVESDGKWHDRFLVYSSPSRHSAFSMPFVALVFSAPIGIDVCNQRLLFTAGLCGLRNAVDEEGFIRDKISKMLSKIGRREFQ